MWNVINQKFDKDGIPIDIMKKIQIHYEVELEDKDYSSYFTSIKNIPIELYNKCLVKYNQRDYLSDSVKRVPPMLYTFPGSGNTWCRLLVERATGILTGSVYNDADLVSTLP
eukprot:gene10398-21683_t